MSAADAVRNVGGKVARRLGGVHKPLLRLMRRRERVREQEAFERETAALDRRLAAIAAGSDPIVVGPWLAEVGYEVLYWIPFLRWFVDAHRIPPQRLIVLSRGGMDAAYAGIAGAYVDIFDVLAPSELAARNASRQATLEGGGQKQSGQSALDDDLLAGARARLGLPHARVLHPSMLFGLFRHAWHGNIPMDFFWCRTKYERQALPATPLPPGLSLPDQFVAAKLYTGPALARSEQTQRMIRSLVTRAAARMPVVVFETPFGLDEHHDFDLRGIPGVISTASWMTPRTNLGLQLALLARAQMFLGTCGGLAWLAPFLDVPAVALYDSDRLLAPHLLVVRQAGKRADAAEFTTLDLRAVARLGLDDGAPLARG
jgi:hypothetical protein